MSVELGELDLASIVAQFSYGTDVKDDQGCDRAEHRAGQAPAQRDAAGQRAQHQRVAGHHRRGRGQARAAPSRMRPGSPPKRSSRPCSRVDGVASVDVSGGEEQQLQVTLDPDKLAKFGISAAQVSGVLAANNLTIPSGQIQGNGMQIPVSTIGQLSTSTRSRASSSGSRCRPGPRARGAPPARAARPRAPPPRVQAVPRHRLCPARPVRPARPVSRRLACARLLRRSSAVRDAGRADPDHHRRHRDGRDGRRPDHGLRALRRASLRCPSRSARPPPPTP